MKYNITGRSLEITESIKTAVDEKLSKLNRYFSPDVVAQVTMSTEKNRQKVEITIVPARGDVIRAESENTDMYVSIDLAVRAIEVQLKKHRKKIIDRHQSPGLDFAAEYIDSDDIEDETEIKIVKRKQFDFKPMNPEEACMQMDLLGHNFFVFINSDTDQTCVVYKRKNDTYGLIEPEN